MLVYNLMMLAIVAVCLAAIQFAFEGWNEGLSCPRLAENGLWPTSPDLLATKA